MRPGAQSAVTAPPGSRVEVSVVVPVFDEVESLAELYREVTEVLERLGRADRPVLVGEGRPAGPFQLRQALHRADDRVRVIQLRRNFGKSGALAAGFEAVRGQTIVTLDADLQDDPAELPRLLARLEDGCDLVSGWKRDRQDPLS